MAETITIPSPALFLSSPATTPPSQREPAAVKAANPADLPAQTKRKQSKSRNGCVTCKAKRLKCDETKPTCQQCAKRSVACGGYKKDFKWRPFEETTFGGAKTAPAKSKKNEPPSITSVPPPPSIRLSESHYSHPQQYQQQHYRPVHSFEPRHNVYHHPSQPQISIHGMPRVSTYVDPPSHHATAHMYARLQPSPYMLGPPPISPVESYMTGSAESNNDMFESKGADMQHRRTTAPSSICSGQSPRLVDLLLPGTDLNVPPEEFSSFREQHESFYQPTGLTPPPDAMDDDVEEIPRSHDFECTAWGMRRSSPSPSSSSSSSSGSLSFPMCKTPRPTSAEMLTRRFDRETCGILSVKDGPTENPWRTLIWPLARDCPALYHAIASMTSFHQSRDTPALRIQGINHMSAAVHALASGLENMRVDAAISTTLVLAFSESWDQHISTGINHIKGAKHLIDRALVQHNSRPMRGEELSRLQFLCNTWTYIDVIARLTSADDNGPNDYDSVFDSFHTGSQNAQLDPLMGCAGTLFPIIGRVANLVRKVRQMDGSENSPTIISQAVELKRQLEDWMPPSYIEDPEDETTSPHDSIKTATAYQYATLLYLHQAVPEIPSLPSRAIAQKICRELATVPLTSRSTIVHIFPLMAAGCEAVGENREWVRERWHMMHLRMKIGVIEKCLEVTKEVWNRRDTYAAEMAIRSPSGDADVPFSRPSLKRGFSSTEDFDTGDEFSWLEPSTKRRATSASSIFDGLQSVSVKSEMSSAMRRTDSAGVENLAPDFTVKGRLHWLGVMRDWNWEVLLG